MTQRLFQLVNTFRHSPVFFNSLALLLLRGINTFTRLFVLFVVARFSAPEEFGAVSFALAIAEIGKVIADFGVDTIAVREFALQQNPQANRAFGLVVARAKALCGGIVYSLIVLLFLLSQKSFVQTSLGWVAGLVVLTGLASNLSINYFQSKLKVKIIVLPVLLINAIATGMIIAILTIKPNVLAGLAVLPATEALSALVLWRYFRRATNVQAAPDGGLQPPLSVRSLLQKSLPVAITSALVVTYTRLDVIVLSNLLNQAALGYYGVAYRVTEPFQFIATAFALSAYSHLSTILTDDQVASRARRFMIRYGLGIFAYGMVVCLVIVSSAFVLIQKFLPAYTPAVPIIQVLAVALMFRILNASLTSFVQAHGHFRWITGVALFNLVSIGLLLTICVPRFGAIGAAIALLAGELFNVVIQGIMLLKIWNRTAIFDTATAASTSGPQKLHYEK